MLKKTKYSSLVLSLFLVLTLWSCEWKNEEEENPSTDCDTSQVTLSGDIKPILTTNCYGCHSTQNAISLGAGIGLEEYEALKVYAEGGSLLGSIRHDSGFSLMPKGGAKLSDCDISKVAAWIEKGSQND